MIAWNVSWSGSLYWSLYLQIMLKTLHDLTCNRLIKLPASAKFAICGGPFRLDLHRKCTWSSGWIYLYVHMGLHIIGCPFSRSAVCLQNTNLNSLINTQILLLMVLLLCPLYLEVPSVSTWQITLNITQLKLTLEVTLRQTTMNRMRMDLHGKFKELWWQLDWERRFKRLETETWLQTLGLLTK
jgi:hypothetical protein